MLESSPESENQVKHWTSRNFVVCSCLFVVHLCDGYQAQMLGIVQRGTGERRKVRQQLEPYIERATKDIFWQIGPDLLPRKDKSLLLWRDPLLLLNPLLETGFHVKSVFTFQLSPWSSQHGRWARCRSRSPCQSESSPWSASSLTNAWTWESLQQDRESGRKQHQVVRLWQKV